MQTNSPQSTVQNNSPVTDPNVELVFPGTQDIVHGQFILRPEGKDIDLYRFTLREPRWTNQPGDCRRATVGLQSSRCLVKTLSQRRHIGSTSMGRAGIHEDYFSKDPRISLDFVRGGEYIVGVSAKGNTSYNPAIEDSGLEANLKGNTNCVLTIGLQPLQHW